jgi:4-amino-4-deoxy-L-arabinose transferase-like glycosyltransferase
MVININISKYFNKIGIISIICTVIIISLLASVPPVSRDALTHHLFIPKLYLKHGSIYEIPHLIFSYYPMNLDLLYIIPVYFGNDIIPKFIHFAFALATGAMIYRYLALRINSAYGLLGALFFLSIPVIVRLSSTVYVDLGLIFFLFASLIFMFKWVEYGFKPKYLIISAVFTGLALGTKYNGLVGLFLIGLFSAFVYARYHAGQKMHTVKSIGWCAVFVIVAMMVFSPWMIRNYAWTGNPVYPLYNRVFNPDQGRVDEPDSENVLKQRKKMSHIQVRRHVYGESWIQIALVPFRVFFQGKDDTPVYFDGKLNPFFLILPIFAFFGIRRAGDQEKTEKFILLFFSVLFLLYACAQTSIRIRYFSPIIPPLVVLSLFGLHQLNNTILPRIRALSAPMQKIIIFSIVIAMLSLNAAYIADRFKKDQPLAYITGKATRDQYIQAFRPEYASFQYANKHLTQKDKIFGLYIGNRGYYSDIPIHFDIEMLQDIAAKVGSGKKIAEKLHEKGFTHIIVNFSLFNYWVQKYGLHEKKMLKEFFDTHTQKVFSKDGYGLLKIRHDPLT